MDSMDCRREILNAAQTPIPAQPTAFTAEFVQLEAKQAQWQAFTRRSDPKGLPSEFAAVIDGVAAFLGPVLSHLAADQPAPKQWQAPGPWHF